MNNTEILKIENVSFSYNDEHEVLKNINLSFKKGETVAILGNNGVGKTTLFMLCNGILRPSHGNIILNGKAVEYSRKELINLRKNVGIVFQDPDNQIIAPMVESEISFGPMNLKLPKEEVKSRIEESLEDMDITHLRNRTTHNLSGGEKKRVCIADILAMKPSVIILDEPTAALDSKGVIMLKETLEKLSQSGITVVISTHDIDFAYDFAKRCVILCKGEVIGDNDMQEIFKNDDIIKKSELRYPIKFEYEEKLKELGIKL